MLPVLIESEDQLEQVLSEPSLEVVQALAAVEGDLLILGVGGKMGPSLARMAARAIQQRGTSQKVIGVSRFSAPGLEASLNGDGIETIRCDLLDSAAMQQLPEVANVVFMAGRKFGSTGSEWLTWAMNTYLPGLVAEKFCRSRIVAFSTGNIYPLTPIAHGGATESQPPSPVGEYAQSCLGRERMFQHFSEALGLQVCLIRLNYAIELRYGVLLDVAQKVWAGEPVDLTMGNANVIWQGDANAMALRSLTLCETPPTILNVTGPETVSIRWVAERFGELLGCETILQGEEASTALLSNAARSHGLFGYPQVSLDQMLQWIAHWVQIGGATLDKPTHFEQRDGKF